MSLVKVLCAESSKARAGQIADKTHVIHNHLHRVFKNGNGMSSRKTGNVDFGVADGSTLLYLSGASGMPTGATASSSCFLVRNGRNLRGTRRESQNECRQRHDTRLGPACNSRCTFVGRQKE